MTIAPFPFSAGFHMRFFLAGIMQGSHRQAVMHDQDYRGRISRLIEEHVPHAEVYDPLRDHGDSLNYVEENGREVFYRHNVMCREIDVLIAYVPEASMGTAIEMWEAFRHGRIVAAVSPLAENWTVRFCSHLLYEGLTCLEADIVSGRFAERLFAIQETLASREPQEVEEAIRASSPRPLGSAKAPQSQSSARSTQDPAIPAGTNGLAPEGFA